jgi:hypothetical protein
MAVFHDVGAFSNDWREARSKFLDAARRAGAEHRVWPHPLTGPAGETLCADTAWLGPSDASRVLVVISGTHGVEGFCGSGPQVGLLRGDAGLALPPDTAMLSIHGINPHGWAWLRRVTEENVDLNRNWVDFDAPRVAASSGQYTHPADIYTAAAGRPRRGMTPPDACGLHGRRAQRTQERDTR